MSNPLQARVAGALTNIRNPRADNDVISAGMIQDLQIEDDGRVALTFVLGRDDPAGLVRETRSAVREVEGVTEVKIKVVEPTAGTEGSRGPGESQAARGQPGAVPPPPAPMEMPNLGHILAISSGKGGVGKSTVASNLAAELARAGRRVGIMDADIYGPNIPRMFGVDEKPPVRGGRIVPLENHNVKLMSLGFLVERDQPAIWRGPIVMKIIQQFLRDVDWGELDYLIVDLPPGTGDAQLSLVQAVHVEAAIIVTTPQEVAIGDGLRGAKMFDRVDVPVIGIVENMSYFECPSCGSQTQIFLSGGGAKLSAELGVTLLGHVPLQAGMADLADDGQPVVVAAPDSPAARAFAEIAKGVRAKIGGRGVKLPIVTG
jgi:ATP-binding protein involved in chromosome partitioning